MPPDPALPPCPPNVPPNAANAPQLNVARLNAVVQAIKDLKLGLRKCREESAQHENILYGTIKVLRANLQGVEQRISELLEYLDIQEEGIDDEGDERAHGMCARSSPVEERMDIKSLMHSRGDAQCPADQAECQGSNECCYKGMSSSSMGLHTGPALPMHP
ncbi:hypothetical protein GY45DRAFT_1331631 [Cubamyces sp. BRFM 1775]|nr:hypothetical protein GY45DRAFT_1331631 [Cubamyces sp. BRFM 1775]